MATTNTFNPIDESAEAARKEAADVAQFADAGLQFAHWTLVEVAQRQAVHLVLDVGAQPGDGALHDHVQQPRLQPDHQSGNHIQRQRQCQRQVVGRRLHAAQTERDRQARPRTQYPGRRL